LVCAKDDAMILSVSQYRLILDVDDVIGKENIHYVPVALMNDDDV